jgi:hypothetical protein
MPILGTVASQFSGKSFGSFESIATATLSSGTGESVEFTSIPSTFKHLQVRGIGRISGGSGQSSMTVKMNNDTNSNYSWHYMYGDQSSMLAGGEASSAYFVEINFINEGNTVANAFSVFIIDILDYASTSKNKTLRSFGGCNYNGAGGLHLESGVWRNNTTPVTSIQFFPGGSSFARYSSWALYGIKG